jgi:hypothetical protein
MAENPWVQHLRQKGVYDHIRQILREAKKDYVSKNPVKRREILARELKNLDECVAISREYLHMRAGYKLKF